LDELGSNANAHGVSSCTNNVGGLLHGLFGVDVDVIVSLGGAIVLSN
jgi:hypothetical protein